MQGASQNKQNAGQFSRKKENETKERERKRERKRERERGMVVSLRDYALWDWIIICRLVANLISHRPNEQPVVCQGALR